MQELVGEENMAKLSSGYNQRKDKMSKCNEWETWRIVRTSRNVSERLWDRNGNYSQRKDMFTHA